MTGWSHTNVGPLLAGGGSSDINGAKSALPPPVFVGLQRLCPPLGRHDSRDLRRLVGGGWGGGRGRGEGDRLGVGGGKHVSI